MIRTKIFPGGIFFGEFEKELTEIEDKLGAIISIQRMGQDWAGSWVVFYRAIPTVDLQGNKV